MNYMNLIIGVSCLLLYLYLRKRNKSKTVIIRDENGNVVTQKGSGKNISIIKNGSKNKVVQIEEDGEDD